MPWQDRIKEAAYTPPDDPNSRIVFQYEDVSREFEKRTTAFTFPGVDGAYIQDQGVSARQYPMRCFFTGDDHDLEALVFEQALSAQGVGTLEHPFYGKFDVVPFGRIVRRDDLKRRANQTVIEVTFWTSTRIVYPSTQLDSRSELETAIDGFIDTDAPNQFADTVDVEFDFAQNNLRESVDRTLAVVQAALGTAAAATEEVNQLFTDAIDAISFSLDVLVGQPLQLAQQVANLISIPARAVISFQDRVVQYAAFARSIFTSDGGNPQNAVGIGLPRRGITIANDFYLADLNAASAVNAALLSALETQFETRTAAQAAAINISNLFDEFVQWREVGYDLLGIDIGTTYQNLESSVALVLGFLIEISFSLDVERVLVLDRPRTVIDVSAELFGEVTDARINDLINNNDLTGSQIIELQRGDVIVYYT